eukprot:881367-Pleurochrysis_carterae.AAC.3
MAAAVKGRGEEEELVGGFGRPGGPVIGSAPFSRAQRARKHERPGGFSVLQRRDTSERQQ